MTAASGKSSTHGTGPAEIESLQAWVQESKDKEEIRTLMLEYAYLIDAGDLEGFAELFRHGRWLEHTGYEEVLSWLKRHIVLYDGKIGTHHVVSNLSIDIAMSGTGATARSYVQLFHSRPQVAEIDTLAGGLYLDTFEKVEGRWRFRHRRIAVQLSGDLSPHLRREPAAPTN